MMTKFDRRHPKHAFRVHALALFGLLTLLLWMLAPRTHVLTSRSSAQVIANGTSWSAAIDSELTQERSDSMRLSPRIAVCMVGDIRSLVRDDMQRNLLLALYKPLHELQVDTFLCVGDTLIKGNSEIKTNYDFRDFYFGGARPISVRVSTHVKKSGGMLSPASKCQKLGYEEAVRLRECMRDVITHERKNEFKYDFLIRTRPDIEYFESLPQSRCWHSLRTDVIWDMDTRFSTGLDKSNAEMLSSIRDVDFVGDWFSVIPRNIAQRAFISLADNFENCIPLASPPEKVCGENNHRWTWPECRFKQAYQEASSEVLVGKLMTESGANFQWHTLARCTNNDCSIVQRQDGQQHCHDRNCSYKPMLKSPIGSDLMKRNSCFPIAGYTSASEWT